MREAADGAYAESIRHSTRDPRLMGAALALVENRIPDAEALLREHLKRHPTDVAAIRMLAEVAARIGRYDDAETLLARCLELAPGFAAARHNYAMVLHRQNKPRSGAGIRWTKLLARGRRAIPAIAISGPPFSGASASTTASIDQYREVLAEYPNQAKVWMSLGHALKTAGRQAESIEAYRRASRSRAEPRRGLLEPGQPQDLPLHARADAGDARAARAATSSRPKTVSTSSSRSARRWKTRASTPIPSRTTARATGCAARWSATTPTRITRTWSARSASSRASSSRSARGWGCDAPDPIFIVGLPRSGSTLIEQILAWHSQVEGTMELPGRRHAGARGGRAHHARRAALPIRARWRNCRPTRSAGWANAISRRRASSARPPAPFFIDKMPNNFAHIGLIHLMLPNAKIIDARRHPLGCCLSGFKQHFARGQNFTYDLADIGRYYRDYVELMAHFDDVLPGRVHRVFYENMVDDTEAEVRRLLDYCGLPFEAGCLRFHENERAVRTASSEQVRQPIYRDGVDQWRHFEARPGPAEASAGRRAEPLSRHSEFCFRGGRHTLTHNEVVREGTD